MITGRSRSTFGRIMGVMAYIAFFVPVLVARKSRFAMFHANQGMVLFLSGVILSTLGVVPLLWMLMFLGPLLTMAMALAGMLNAARGLSKQLPLIGRIQLLTGADAVGEE